MEAKIMPKYRRYGKKSGFRRGSVNAKAPKRRRKGKRGGKLVRAPKHTHITGTRRL
jgi:hypothetical protein